MKKLLKYPVLLAFCAYILFFTAYDLTQTNRVFSDFENRYLTQKPAFSMQDLLNNTYTKKYEEYINDQFVLRDGWIAMKSMAETALGKIENNGIVYGKDHYLFEKMRFLEGDQYQRNCNFIREFAELYPQQSITLAVVPNSYSILQEKVPLGLNNVDQRGEIAHLYRQMQGTQASVLDLFAPLEAHSDEYIYYRTDHHWTTLGAYYGYAAYIRQLGRTPVPLEELQGTTVEGFYGTYFSKAKNHDAVADTITYYDIPASEVRIDGQTYDGYYDLEKFAVRDKYAAFLRGNNGYTVLKSAANRDHREGETSRILVVKDSYGNSMVPYLLYHFDEVHILDLRSNREQMSEVLESNAFEDVLLLYNFMNLATDTNIYRLRY